MSETIYKGNCLEELRKIEAGSIDVCLTSPPYWGLRDYGHKDQYGTEKTPGEYIEKMVAVFNEVKRALKKEGTLWLNIGDTYSGSGKGSGDIKPDPKFKAGGRERSLKPDRNKELSPKCLYMIPERLAWALIQDGWILRNKIIWYKPNGMPSSVKDRFVNKWEYLLFFSKSGKYYFDLDAVREQPLREPTYKVVGQKGSPVQQSAGGISPQHPLGKNPGDVFAIPTQAFPAAHFAVFPERLCEKPIKAGSPEGGTVLDPFCGTGTAGVVAKKNNRNFIGIDIKQKYIDMAQKRIDATQIQLELRK